MSTSSNDPNNVQQLEAQVVKGVELQTKVREDVTIKEMMIAFTFKPSLRHCTVLNER